jgi:putative ABC transport system permease protein
MHDLRFAWRLILRQPLLTAVAAFTIAVGVGANTAIVSVVKTALINPLGLRHSSQVLVARVGIDRLNMHHAPDSGVEFREIQAMTDAFQSVAAIESRSWTSELGSEATRLVGSAVSPDFFAVFAEQPALGRFFTADDRESVVLSDGFWRTGFGADRNVLGQVLRLDGKPYRIIGVAAPEFRFPAAAQAWTPLVLNADRLRRRGWFMTLGVFARLKDGLTPAQGADRIHRYVAALKAEPANADMARIGYRIEVDRFAEYIGGDLRRPLMLLWIAAGVVMLAGCANVAGLLLTRGANRKREIAIRISLGAGRFQVMRQLLIESVLLGAVGGVVGLGVARLGVLLMRQLAIPGNQVLKLVSLDREMLFYGLLLALASGVLFGLAPALQFWRDSQTSSLARNRRRWFQDAFVVAQVAAAFTLVAVTGLLVRSLWTIEQLRPGFDPSRLTTAFVTKPGNDQGFLDRLEMALSSIPGVEAAALANSLPFAGAGFTSTFQIQGRKPQPGEPEWHGQAYMVSPRYFETTRIPLRRGRSLSPADAAPNAPLVCVVDARLAERFFPSQDAIGQSLVMYVGPAQIVGVVGSIRDTTLEEGSRPAVYYPIAKIPFFPQVAVIARSSIPAGSIIRNAVRATSRSAPVYDIRTMDDRIAESLGIRRVVVTLLAVFGSISLLLAAIGLYGVIAQVVGERTQEIGVRVVLGARPAQILWQFMRQGLRAGLAGLFLGLLAAAYAQRWLAGMLYEIRGFDPVTYLFVAISILLILAIAVWRPAQRAARLDPQTALRRE